MLPLESREVRLLSRYADMILIEMDSFKLTLCGKPMMLVDTTWANSVTYTNTLKVMNPTNDFVKNLGRSNCKPVKWNDWKINFRHLKDYILYHKIQSVCVCVSMYVCWSGIGSKTMRTTVMKLLQVTQWV